MATQDKPSAASTMKTQLLKSLGECLKNLQAVDNVASIASEISNCLLTWDKQHETIRLAFSLHALSCDYSGLAREIVGTAERQRRAVLLWTQNALKQSSENDTFDTSSFVEELCSMWDSLVTIALELTSRHGHLIGTLALDSDVYSRLSSQIMASQCYEPSSTALSRASLIRSATETCHLNLENATPLVPLLLAVKEERRSLAGNRGSASPTTPATPTTQRIIDICHDKWFALETNLDLATNALIAYTSTMYSIHSMFSRDTDAKTVDDETTSASLHKLEANIEKMTLRTKFTDLSKASHLFNAPLFVGKLLDRDPEIRPYLKSLIYRYSAYQACLDRIEEAAGSIENFSEGYNYYGFQKEGERYVFREWCPNIRSLSLVGDFNNWDATMNIATHTGNGVWCVDLGSTIDIDEGSFIKVSIVTAKGNTITRISPWALRTVQPKGEIEFVSTYVSSSTRHYEWQHPRPQPPKSLRIYEAHVGISSSEPLCATFKHFTTNVLPRIKAQNYNCIQLMAVMEHAYYGSFGYQVTSFFAIASRNGTIQDLKELVDTAHKLGLTVLLDVVHSHASKNINDGLNQFNGTNACYFHDGQNGDHPQWDSRLFNYGSMDVLKFLLSNLRWYLEEYKFDGFRFDGVTSMLYHHHGMGKGFGGYDDYFDGSLNTEACVYLMLANTLIKSVLPTAISIAEDVSGLPAIARPINETGFGFDYRLAMGVPDYWIKLLKETMDEDWDMGKLVHVLTDRRHAENVIAYAESHDQALVGDKTIAFWLMDKEMYSNMSVLQEAGPVVQRGMAMHKLIRLITHTLAGEGFLNFIGNEFGHPEWLDFPTKNNNESYHYARRQWNLVDDPNLRYKFLNEFDKAMNVAEEKFSWLSSPQAFVSLKHEQDKVIVFERANLIFAFNFNVSKSFQDYRIGAPQPGKYGVLLCSDFAEFGGLDRVDRAGTHFTSTAQWNNRPFSLRVYLPCRTALILQQLS